MAAGPGRVQRDFLLLKLRGVPSQARGYPVQRGGQSEGGVRAHAQRQRPGDRAHVARDRGKLSAEGRQRGSAAGAAALLERGGDSGMFAKLNEINNLVSSLKASPELQAD